MKLTERKSGVLLHPTSLPSPYGIGELGKSAYEFIDFLEDAGQRLWQVLPLTHTGFGDSPYQSFSAFAGQPLLISLENLLKLELITKEDLKDCPESDPSHVDYAAVIPWKQSVLKIAYENFLLDSASELTSDFQVFCKDEAFWLDDYALFLTCKDLHSGKCWLEWDKEYQQPTKAFKKELLAKHKKEMDYYKFLQFLFFRDWAAVKQYANDHNIEVIGDIPIFVSMDSADVWANQHLFQLDSKGYPLAVAGVPPDYFSATGQLWGNPLYDWKAHKKEGFAWWISRIKNQLKTIDILRIDHFRGFEAYWSIPYGEETAINGKWVKAPGSELFTAIKKALGDLPIIAEDLGTITPEVHALLAEFDFPGMKVLQFAFESLGEGSYLPHQYTSQNCVCYTGTHDNDTTIGWFKSLKPDCRKKVFAYGGFKKDRDVADAFIRLAMASIAAYAVFPLQDVLKYDSDGRMNTPGVAAGNWNWRYEADELLGEYAQDLKKLSVLYGRNILPEPEVLEEVPEEDDVKETKEK